MGNIAESEAGYAIIGLSRKDANAAALAAAAVKSGCRAVRLELCGKGAWSARELDALKKGLAALGEALVLGILKGHPLHLVNFEEAEDAAGGCGIFTGRLLADGDGNYMLVPPQWRYDGRGVKLGHADKGIAKFNGCVYDAASAACAECLRKNLAGTGYDARATLEFDLGVRKALESIKYLAKSKPVFKAYLERVRQERERESGLLINEKK